ncbi:MAG TPA: HlyD family efflux transporter periplasmic adaptor subunit [Alphaproteobacteria bacterium]|nr:HlyD family efflux transporter periplasmic adaptor subunit [Alphaproteobacteria bacterium]
MLKELSAAQIVRFLLGGVVLGVILYFYAPRVFFNYSTSAVLTARLIPIKTPLPGIIDPGLFNIGTEIEQNDQLFSITNPNLDRSELELLGIEKNGLLKAIETGKREISELEALKEKLEQSTEKYRKSLSDRTALELEISKQKISQAKADRDESSNLLARKSKLLKKGFSSVQDSEKAQFSFQKYNDYVTQLEFETKKYQLQIEHLNKDVFINTDGRSDIPFQEQKLYDIQMKIIDIKKNIEESTHRIEDLEQAIKTKGNLLDRLEKATVGSPVKGAIWRVYSSVGNFEDKNNIIMDVLDCSHMFMSATIGSKMFERLKVGQKAFIYLSGAEKEIVGEIAYLRGGSLDPKSTDMMIARNSINRENEMEVLIKIDTSQLDAFKGDFCDVGRVGDVHF